MSEGADLIREELARQGIAVTGDDLAAIAKIVAANRAALARVPADAVDEPEVSHGFLPPAPPDPSPPAGDGTVRRTGRRPHVEGGRDDA
jgi:hypothetical protein